MFNSEGTPRAQQPATVAALLVVAVVAIFQTAVIFLTVGEQRDAAHVIDISGAQRMRTQGLAYFALSMATAHGEPDAAAKSERLIGDLLSTRAEIIHLPIYVVGRRANGTNALTAISDQYISEIRAVERNPKDTAALAAVRRDRPILLAWYDAAVKKRVLVANGQHDRLVAYLFLGLLLQIGSIAGVWFLIVAPSERRGALLLADVRYARKEIESTFASNPDGIAIFNRTGHLVRANASRAAMTGHNERALIGRHVTDMVAPAQAEKARNAFEAAIDGKTVAGETQFVRKDGSLVDVAVTIFPRLIDDVPSGIAVVSKDLSKLRAAEALNAEQVRRLKDLYDIASAHGRSPDELLNSAISLVTARLGYDYGVVTEIVDDLVSVTAVCGAPKGFVVGDVQSIHTSLSRLAVDAPDVYQHRDFPSTPLGKPLAKLGWASVAGMKIFIGGILYGTVGFASSDMRESDLSTSDVGFMRLACTLIGTIIERGRQLQRLDSLAFSDTLTGLPNRARFSRRLTESIADGTTFALHYVDLDRFKSINDRFGHAIGDTVLRIAAERLLKCARSTDMVVRLGGDEFAIVQAGPVDRERATLLADRVVKAFSTPIDLGGVKHDVGASLGVALFPTHATDARGLVDAADAALYRAKRGGRRRFAHADAEGAANIA